MRLVKTAIYARFACPVCRWEGTDIDLRVVHTATGPTCWQCGALLREIAPAATATVAAKEIPEGLHRIRFAGLERITSPTKGLMWRLVAQVADGPYSGASVYKPLTDDHKGWTWLARVAQRVLGYTPAGSIEDIARALEGLEIVVTTYCAIPDGG